MNNHRSYEQIEAADLHRLAELAHIELTQLFDRRPYNSGIYRDKCLLLCLAQGAALHYVDGISGIKDFDVWAFFEMQTLMQFPVRWRATADFGISRFGRDPEETSAVAGRRVDILGRSLRVDLGDTGVKALQRYLSDRRTQTSWFLSQKPVVAIWPSQFFMLRIN